MADWAFADFDNVLFAAFVLEVGGVEGEAFFAW